MTNYKKGDTLFNHLSQLPITSLVHLFNEAEELEKTGVLPESAVIRNMSKHFFEKNDVFYMTTVCYNIYRVFAHRSIKMIKRLFDLGT